MEVRQTLLDHITLQEQLQVAGSFELWSGTDAAGGARYLVSVLPAGALTAVAARIEATDALVHPSLLRTAEHGVGDGQYVLAATVPPGYSPVPTERLSATRTWTLLAQIIDALDYAHALGFAHGSLTPASIFTNRNDDIRLLNHGLAVSPVVAPWASPQQTGDRAATVADDIFALGALAFGWLTGDTWQVGADFPQAGTSPSVRTTVLAMLSEAPYDRPQSVAEVRALLENELAGGVELAPIPSRAAAPAPTPGPAPAPAAGNPGVLVTPRQRSVPVGLAAGMFALLVIAIALVVFLPDGTDAPPPPIVIKSAEPEAVAAVEAPAPGLAPMELARLEQMRKDATAAAQDLLEVLVDLEDAGALDWAPDEYKRISLDSNRGDTLFREDAPAGALEVYNTLKSEAAVLYDSRFDVAAENREAGTAAFNAGNLETARQLLSIAQQIEPDDPALADMLSRASSLEVVQTLLGEGNAAEDEGNFDRALTQYENALALDAAWPATQAAISNVRERIRERNFASWMSEGFAALTRQDFDGAKGAFEAALAIKPDSAEVRDGLSQAAFIKLAAQLKTLETTAREQVAAEDWTGARSSYAAMLALDPSLVLAAEGRDNAVNRQQLDDEISYYISNPLLLTSDAEYEKAKGLISKGSRLGGTEGRLAAQIIELTTQLTQARIPVNLEVRSDNQTNLSVASVGALGRIRTRELQLYPGVYTIVGKRRGYKDVSTRVTLLAGSEPEPVFVSCSEKI